MIDTLKAAMIAFSKGELGERELIAVSLAVNDAVAESFEDGKARAAYRVFAAEANRKLMDRVAELDGERQ